MKIYYLTYTTPEKGELEAFTSKRAAQKRLTEIRKEQADAELEYNSKEVHDYGDSLPFDQLPFGIDEAEFSISASGILSAFESGAWNVPK